MISKKIKKVKIMGSCQGQKMHIQNNGEARTGNEINQVYSSNGSLKIRKR